MEIKGFELDRFIEKIDAYFVCGFCQLIVRNPVECKVCECLFCKQCQKEKCSNNCETVQFGEPGKFVRLVYEKIQMKCKYVANGCEWLDTIAKTTSHESECLYEIVSCENPICTNKFMKKDKFGEKIVCSLICNYVISFKDTLTTQDQTLILTEFCKYLDISKKDALDNQQNKQEEGVKQIENLQQQLESLENEKQDILKELDERKKKSHLGKFNAVRQKWSCCEGEKFSIGCREI